MKILAIDTALTACSLAILADDRPLAIDQREIGRGQAEILMPMVKAALTRAGMAVADLDLIAVTVGPGTFTGVRVGLACARGLALVSGRPVAGVTTLAAIAAGIPLNVRSGESIVVAIDAGRGEVYTQAFAEDLRPLSAPAVLTTMALAQRLPDGPVVLAGDAAKALAAQAHDNPWIRLAGVPPYPDPVVVARLGAQKSVLPPAPLYLRAPAVTVVPRPAAVSR
jgi:tRNA threonylcarbamoyladenosine biosynthesis protein TsaB